MGRKFLSELHDPNHRKAEGQKGELLTEDEAEQRFDAMIAKLDAEDRAAHDASRRRAAGRQVRSTDGRVDGGARAFKARRRRNWENWLPVVTRGSRPAPCMKVLISDG